jgi:hypothetical protein
MRASRVLTLIVPLMLSCGVRGAETPGEQVSGYTYVPVDPLPVLTTRAPSCTSDAKFQLFLDSLSDNAVRTSIEKFDAKVGATYVSGSSTVKGEMYRITSDYVNTDTVSVRLWIKKEVPVWNATAKLNEYNVTSLFGFEEDDSDGRPRYTVKRPIPAEAPLSEKRQLQQSDSQLEGFEEVYIPIYIGIGLRLTARVTSVESKVDVAGLQAVGFAAEARRVRGTLTAQTIGLNSEKISDVLPIQSDLNATTVGAATIAIASVKGLVRKADTVAAPRVVGFYLPFASDQSLVNAIISALSQAPIEWARPCGYADDNAEGRLKAADSAGVVLPSVRNAGRSEVVPPGLASPG